uniref:SAC3/GANP/THP3 conserved domain-containing protein n=1 Tax=Ciona savignyi TaxID=51511 RepID=H2YJ19_CIOSA
MTATDQNIIVGICWTMCPIEELRFRSKHNLLHSFEKEPKPGVQKGRNKLNLTEHGNICVKEFRRSAAGENVSNPKTLRTPEVLLETIEYLFSNILFRKDAHFNFTYDFIFDRLRSVRQDTVIQQLHKVRPMVCVAILERCVRFYIYAAYRTKLNPEMAIDLHINTQHTVDCLKTLLLLYNDMEYRFREQVKLQHRLSMVAVYMLLHIQNHDVLCGLMINVPNRLWKLEPLKTVLEMAFAVMHKNYVRFIKLTSKLVSEKRYVILLTLCLCIDRLRVDCIQMLCHSHNSKACSFSAQDLCSWLFLNNASSATHLCNELGLTCPQPNVIKFFKSDFIHKDTNKVHGCNLIKTVQQLNNDEIINILRYP